MPDFFTPVTARLDRIERELATIEQQLLALLNKLLNPPARVVDLKAKRNLAMSTTTLTWTNPTTRVDGSALAPTDIASIDVFDSANPAPAGPIASILGDPVTYTTDVLSPGDHGFTVVVNDTAGHASSLSNVASVTVVPVVAAPTAVTNLAATLNP
jgi:hypothetical protein